MYWTFNLFLSVQLLLITFSDGEWWSRTGQLSGPNSNQQLLARIAQNVWSFPRGQISKETNTKDGFKINENGSLNIGVLGSTLNSSKSKKKLKKKERKKRKRKKKIEIELGVFVDENIHQKLQSLYLNEEKINDVILALISQIEAIFKQPHLEPEVDLLITHMEIFQTQPEELEMEGDLEAFSVLSTFCDYQMKRNGATNNSHWDMALYFTGKDLFTLYQGTKSSGTMGLSVIDGICQRQHSCVIGEFVSGSSMGHPSLSSGWMASYIMAHEMGHNLGMLHDGYGNNCSRDGFLMSATRSYQGETTWSECSVSTLKRIHVECVKVAKVSSSSEPSVIWNNHKKFNLVPGLTWNANEQCQLFLMDDEAKQITDPIEDVCNSIKCVSKKRIGHFYAGPALDGTFCGSGKWCKSGKCVSNDRHVVTEGVWSPWTIGESKCTSGCILKAKGTVTSHRQCNRPKRTLKDKNMGAVCDGQDFKVELCDDSTICGNEKKRSVESVVSEKCAKYSEILPLKNLTSKGGQMPYNKNRLWQSCSIYCKTNGGVWYTPRYDSVGGLHENTPHLPDGTWCHVDPTRQHYYCLNGDCIPETRFHLHFG